MEQRLKERLTGAAILVALVVLVVPELFRGHIADRGSKNAASSEGPPVRSYTIDLGDSHAVPMQLSPVAPRPAPLAGAPSGLAPLATGMPAGTDAAPGDALANASVGASSVSLPTAAPPHLRAPLPATSAPPRATARVTPSHAVVGHGEARSTQAPHPQSEALRTESTRTRTELARTEVARSEGARAAAHEIPAAFNVHWSVQLGLFSKRANAERMVQSAQAKGFEASLSKPDDKGRYHVHVAGLSSRTAALTLVTRLHAAGLPAAAVGSK